MTEEFGPLDPDSEGSGPAWQLAGWVMGGVVSLINQLGWSEATYDHTKNRLSLHGESEKAGSAFRAGAVAGALPIMTVLYSVCLLVLVVALPLQGMGPAFLIPSAMLLAGSAVGVWLTMKGSVQRLGDMTVYDHTTEPTPETDDLAAQYVDGEIESVDELEAQAEARLE